MRESLRSKHYPDNSLSDNIIDFGFHYADQIDIVINAAKVLELYGMWPNEGSYFEQDVNLVADMLRYTQIERHYERTEFTRNT